MSFDNERPCGTCGAEVGQPCADDCGNMNAYLEDHDLPDEAQTVVFDLAKEARAALRKVAGQLPFAGLLTDPPDLPADDEHDVWLARIAVWLEDYRVLLAAKVEELQEGNRKAIGLQLEKDMVRHFLGVTG